MKKTKTESKTHTLTLACDEMSLMDFAIGMLVKAVTEEKNKTSLDRLMLKTAKSLHKKILKTAH